MASPDVEMICHNCGTTYLVPFRLRKQPSKYCTLACYFAYKARSNIIRQCGGCGKDISVIPSDQKQKFCSKRCEGIGRAFPKFDKSDPSSIDKLREHFSYDPETGVLTWIKRQAGSNSRIWPGTQVTRTRPDGYIDLSFRCRRLLAHVVAWALHYGEWPTSSLDHVNGLRTDNRIANLRLATRGQNSHNRIARNDTGFAGVYKRKNRYYAHLGCNGKQTYIGSFRTVEEAVKARLEKAKELGVYDFCASRANLLQAPATTSTCELPLPASSKSTCR